MFFTIRELIKKQGIGKNVLKELEEREFEKMPIIGDSLKIGRKNYQIVNIIIADGMKKRNEEEMHMENYIDVLAAMKVQKNEQIKNITRRDRYQHDIIERKDGSYYTVDKEGRKIREWDKDNKLIFGKPYPNTARANDGV